MDDLISAVSDPGETPDSILPGTFLHLPVWHYYNGNMQNTLSFMWNTIYDLRNPSLLIYM